MEKKTIKSLFVFLTIFVLMILFSSWGICITDGCVFGSSACIDGACIGESMSSHLSERALMTSATIDYQYAGFLFVVLLFYFFLQKYLLELMRVFTSQLYVKYKIFSSADTKLFNWLTLSFSDGILNPKII